MTIDKQLAVCTMNFFFIIRLEEHVARKSYSQTKLPQ